MRFVAILAVLAVFGAMLLFDTAALIRLTAYCAGGNCGASTLSVAIGAGVIVLAVAAIAWWQTRLPSRPTKSKAHAARKPRSPHKPKPTTKSHARKPPAKRRK